MSKFYRYHESIANHQLNIHNKQDTMIPTKEKNNVGRSPFTGQPGMGKMLRETNHTRIVTLFLFVYFVKI